MNIINELLSSLQISVLQGNYSILTPEWSDDAYCPDYYRFKYVVDGQCKVVVDKKVYYAKKGELYLFPANIPQQYALAENCASCTQYWVHFNLRSGNSIELLKTLQVPVCVTVNKKYVLCLFSKIIDSVKQSHTIAQSILAHGYLMQLLGYFFAQCENSISFNHSDAYRQMQPVISYIEENLSQKLSLGTLAKLVCLHPNYFSKKFAELTGLSPTRYLLKRRMEKAKILLKHSDKNILDIAEATGFSDQFQFSTMFKKKIGMSPLSYRISCRKI